MKSKEESLTELQESRDWGIYRDSEKREIAFNYGYDLHDKELTQNIIDVNIILADIIKSQATQLGFIHDLNDRIVELEKEKK